MKTVYLFNLYANSIWKIFTGMELVLILIVLSLICVLVYNQIHIKKLSAVIKSRNELVLEYRDKYRWEQKQNQMIMAEVKIHQVETEKLRKNSMHLLVGVKEEEEKLEDEIKRDFDSGSLSMN